MSRTMARTSLLTMAAASQRCGWSGETRAWERDRRERVNVSFSCGPQCVDVLVEEGRCTDAPSGRRSKTASLNFSLRHEVARLIVWHGGSTRPVVPSTVSYEDVREGNDPYRALGHGTHSLPTGT